MDGWMSGRMDEKPVTRIKVDWVFHIFFGREKISSIQQSNTGYINHSRTGIILSFSWQTYKGLHSFVHFYLITVWWVFLFFSDVVCLVLADLLLYGRFVHFFRKNLKKIGKWGGIWKDFGGVRNIFKFKNCFK